MRNDLFLPIENNETHVLSIQAIVIALVRHLDCDGKPPTDSKQKQAPVWKRKKL